MALYWLFGSSLNCPAGLAGRDAAKPTYLVGPRRPSPSLSILQKSRSTQSWLITRAAVFFKIPS